MTTTTAFLTCLVCILYKFMQCIKRKNQHIGALYNHLELLEKKYIKAIELSPEQKEQQLIEERNRANKEAAIIFNDGYEKKSRLKTLLKPTTKQD